MKQSALLRPLRNYVSPPHHERITLCSASILKIFLVGRCCDYCDHARSAYCTPRDPCPQRYRFPVKQRSKHRPTLCSLRSLLRPHNQQQPPSRRREFNLRPNCPQPTSNAAAATHLSHITSFSKRAALPSQMSTFARTSAASASREASPVPQTNSTNAVNEAYMKQERKKLSGKLFRLDSPAKSSKQTLPVPRVNGEGKHNCGPQTKNL